LTYSSESISASVFWYHIPDFISDLQNFSWRLRTSVFPSLLWADSFHRVSELYFSHLKTGALNCSWNSTPNTNHLTDILAGYDIISNNCHNKHVSHPSFSSYNCPSPCALTSLPAVASPTWQDMGHQLLLRLTFSMAFSTKSGPSHPQFQSGKPWDGTMMGLV
jgi:hypothetical protein